MSNDEPTSGTPEQGSCYRFENVEFDEPKGELRVARQPVAMEPRPLRVLHELLQRANEVVTKEELFEAVWDGRPTVDHVLANAISKLRSAMGEAAGRRIVTVPRVGYRLDGPVQRIESLAPRTVLVPGQVVPGRESFVLDAVLGAASRSEVWLARHAKLGHMKVFKFANTAESLRALKREYTLSRALRRELAAGEEQGFAAVADANFAQAPYFLELPYIGPDLLRWSQQSPQWAALSREERLRLFIQVARNLALAHNVGILHKDIKPANLLVSETGNQVQWVLTDFGSGHAVDPERIRQLGITAMGMTVSDVLADGNSEGTPLYLAPELLKGHSPTVQSDIFSMGVLLFQVLVGDLKRPMSTGWQREVGDELLVEDISRATEGKPEDRAASLAEWATGLERLQQRRAERQQREDARVLLDTQQRALELRSARKPWVVGAVAVLVLALLTSLFFFQRERGARLMAKAEAERAQAINEFLNEDVLQSADASELAPGEPDTMSAVVKRASTLATVRFQESPLTEASVRGSLGKSRERIGDALGAEFEYRRAFELLSEHKPTGDTELLHAQLDLAGLLALLAKPQESRRLLKSAEASLSPEQLAAHPRLAIALAQTRQNSFSLEQKNEEAVEAARETVRLVDGLQDADTPKNLKQRVLARRILSENLWRVGKTEEAEAVLVQITQPPLRDVRRTDVQQAREDLLMVQIQMAKGRLGTQKDKLLRAISVLQTRLGPNNNEAAGGLLILGGLYSSEGDFTKAVSAHNEALHAFAETMGADHPNTRIAALNLALTQVNSGQPAVALQSLLQERAAFVKQVGADSPVVQAIDFYAARALNMLNRGKEALERLAPLKPEILAQAEPTPGWNWQLQAERGRAMLEGSQRAEGAKLLRQAIEELAAVDAPKWQLDSHRERLKQFDQRNASR